MGMSDPFLYNPRRVMNKVPDEFAAFLAAAYSCMNTGTNDSNSK